MDDGHLGADLDVSEVRRRYVEGESAQAIARALGHGKDTVLRVLHHDGVDVRPNAAGRRKYRAPAIEGFSAPLDDLHAYWLGFLTAHSSIQRSVRGGHRLTVALRAEDASHLVVLREGLGTDVPIRPHHKGQALLIIDRALCDVLGAWGVGERCSLPDVDEGPRRPVLRGYWDAHGTVSGRPGHSNVNIVAGDTQILEQAADWLDREGVASLGIWPLTGQSRMLALSRARDNLDQLHAVLYGDPCSVYLARQRRRLEAVLISRRGLAVHA